MKFVFFCKYVIIVNVINVFDNYYLKNNNLGYKISYYSQFNDTGKCK